jgi:hypothetical protein
MLRLGPAVARAGRSDEVLPPTGPQLDLRVDAELRVSARPLAPPMLNAWKEPNAALDRSTNFDILKSVDMSREER